MGQPLYILAPYVPTPQDVVERMLELAQVNNKDVVYDLGCGDGRIVITAASKYGARGVGVDIEPYWKSESQANAKHAGVEDLVTFTAGDALTIDLSQATVVTLYLVEWSTAKLQPIIRNQVKPGTRIVSHSFGTEMDGWTPDKTEEFIDASGAKRNVHLWIVDNATEQPANPSNMQNLR